MIAGRAATVAGMAVGWLCSRITGCSWLPPACASVMIRFTHDWSAEPLAFQSSVSTDQFQTAIRRPCARLSVVLLVAPYGGRKKHG